MTNVKCREAPEKIPGIQSATRGFLVQGGLSWRAWDGIVADVWHVKCEAGAAGSYTAPYPRLFVLLEISAGGRLELSAPTLNIGAVHEKEFSLAYIPARLPVESRAISAGELRHLDIHLPETALTRKLGRLFDPQRVNAARLQFDDDRVAAIVRLLAEECLSPAPLNDRYGAALTEALIAALFEVGAEKSRQRATLSRAQLNQSLDYIDQHCFETIRLSDLSTLLGLSETYFSHAFKASTGVPPLRWQMEARIGKVKDLLARDDLSLTEISALSGFSDQAHLTRSFKNSVGVTPSAWRKSAR